MILENLRQYQVLETKRLLLRPVTLADANAMFAYASDEENTRWNFPVNQTLEETKAAIQNIYLKTPLGRYGIVLKGTNSFIGTIDLMNFSDGKIAELGYIINKNYWNQGLATEASQKILALCFEKLGLEEVHGYCALNNPASARVLSKLGMTEIERLPNDKILNGQSITSQHFVVTKTAWQHLKQP